MFVIFDNTKHYKIRKFFEIFELGQEKKLFGQRPLVNLQVLKPASRKPSGLQRNRT